MRRCQSSKKLRRPRAPFGRGCGRFTIARSRATARGPRRSAATPQAPPSPLSPKSTAGLSLWWAAVWEPAPLEKARRSPQVVGLSSYADDTTPQRLQLQREKQQSDFAVDDERTGASRLRNHLSSGSGSHPPVRAPGGDTERLGFVTGESGQDKGSDEEENAGAPQQPLCVVLRYAGSGQPREWRAMVEPTLLSSLVKESFASLLQDPAPLREGDWYSPQLGARETILSVGRPV